MHNVQNLFNAHLLGKAVGRNGLLPSEHPEQLRQILREPKQSKLGLQLPSSTGGFREPKMSLWSNEQDFLATYSFSSLSRVPRQSILPRRTLWQKSRGRSSITKCSAIKL